MMFFPTQTTHEYFSATGFTNSHQCYIVFKTSNQILHKLLLQLKNMFFRSATLLPKDSYLHFVIQMKDLKS